MHVTAPSVNQKSKKLESSSGYSREQESFIVQSSVEGFKYFSNTGEHTHDIVILKILCIKYIL
jgi:hypothetical protein